MENSSFPQNLTLWHPTSGPTAPTEDEILELPLVIILCTVLGVASVLGTLGNSLVLLSIIKFDTLRAIPDLFIFSLSLSDFLVTALYQPLSAYRFAHWQQASTNVVFLVITSFLGHFSLIASITNMFGVTVERLISIRFPLKYDLLVTTRRAIVTVICIWIFSITYGAIWSRGLVSEKYLAIYFILVLIGTVSIYFYIFLITKRLEDSVVQVQNESTDVERPNIRRERKAAKTIAIILGVAVVCWLPLLIVPQVLGKDVDRATFLKVFNSLHVLSVCNCSINPYIYCVRSRRYSVAFVNLLGLQRVVKVQATVAPAYSPRNPALNAGDRPPQEIQSLQGEINDVSL
ncbi:Melanocortin receptor 4 [Desmophyllum pertusum]|uniref:Melanocortin receptor 4 n=1 Tax=Desmophyllum pertusum TaxID=174260 RepID=A0A9W9YFP3_9CNID|nr:Melanocortin receptor 4 [Desmophyllum pertusum]